MSEATHLIFTPGTSLKKFNQRIQSVCSEQPVTRMTMSLVKGGCPKITLFTDDVEADEDDVKEGTAEEVGEAILAGPPVCGLLAVTSAVSPEDAEKTEGRLEQLDDICASSIVDEIDLCGQDFAWVQPRDEDGEIIEGQPPVYLPVMVSYTLLVFEIMTQAEETGDDEADKDNKAKKKKKMADEANDPVGEDPPTPVAKGSKKKAAAKKKKTAQETEPTSIDK